MKRTAFNCDRCGKEIKDPGYDDHSTLRVVVDWRQGSIQDSDIEIIVDLDFCTQCVRDELSAIVMDYGYDYRRGFVHRIAKILAFKTRERAGYPKS